MKKVSALLLLLALIVVSGCGSDESREDADDIGNGKVEKTAPNAAAFNNKYPNVEHKCLFDRGDTPTSHGTGLRAVVTTGGVILVIPDPHCPGYVPEQGTAIAGTGN